MAAIPDKTFTLYKRTPNPVTIDFYEASHRYIVRETGKRPISVTGATGMIDKSRPLMIWAENLSVDFLLNSLKEKKKITEELIREACHQHAVKKEEGATSGNIVHDYIEEFIKGEKPELAEEEKTLNGITAFHQMVKEWEMEFIESEALVYSKKHQFVGKLDVTVKCKIPTLGSKKLVCLGDFKTNNWKLDKKTGIRESVLYPEQRYQLAGYRLAREEEQPGYYTGPRLMFALDKTTGDFKVHNLDESPEHYQEDVKCFLAALTLKKRDKELSAWGD